MGENPESNREPLVPQTNVLPIELFPPAKGPEAPTGHLPRPLRGRGDGTFNILTKL